ncbi:unnamed protein product [Acanthoscelides obtectus]|uniref:Uncharacterized protein n=1 Tax=Acanthoscelides obtectus TaxID=200917 RepID=A0A9P0PHB9_ACAOB|nr:unnamed protein product [Acanthoscelides obtectus]CAH1999466.1 unnamed protein product [Acanthoscelides obtectus]CAK1681642.1 hypothetical protein AOBTE_LOCUS33185 [Acanthoscelides obtectus]CAK1681709.1 hypothetical protein AOBTE_LOCUS33235 [Acanthoscelides obtectus]
MSVYLALPILASSAANPWVYGYRNSELRCAVRRVVDDLLTALGFTYRSQANSSPAVAPSAAATVGDAGSFIDHVQHGGGSLIRSLGDWKTPGEFLLVPIARPESSGVVSDCARLVSSDSVRVLRTSRSMVETFAVNKGSEVVIAMDGMKHGSSVI